MFERVRGECEGWVCEREAIGAPSMLRLITENFTKTIIFFSLLVCSRHGRMAWARGMSSSSANMSRSGRWGHISTSGHQDTSFFFKGELCLTKKKLPHIYRTYGCAVNLPHNRSCGEVSLLHPTSSLHPFSPSHTSSRPFPGTFSSALRSDSILAPHRLSCSS